MKAVKKSKLTNILHAGAVVLDQVGTERSHRELASAQEQGNTRKMIIHRQQQHNIFFALDMQVIGTSREIGPLFVALPDDHGGSRAQHTTHAEHARGTVIQRQASVQPLPGLQIAEYRHG